MNFLHSPNHLSFKKLFTRSIGLLLIFILNEQPGFPQPVPVIQWQKCLGGSRNDVANDVLLTADGSIVVVGSSQSNDGNVSGHHGSLDSTDAWIGKLDGSGNLIWQKSIGGINNDVFKTIIATGDGNYLCIGYAFSTEGDIAYNNGSADYFIVKISKDGNIIWSKTFGGSLSDMAYDGILTSDGKYAIIGASYSDDGDVQSKGFGRTSADAWVIKLDTAGNILWENCSGDTTVYAGVNIIETNDHNFMGCLQSTYSYKDPGEVIQHANGGKVYKVNKDNGNFSYVGNALVDQSSAYEYSHSGNSYSFCKRNNGFIISYQHYYNSSPTTCSSNDLILNNVVEHGFSEIATLRDCTPGPVGSGLAGTHGITALSDSSLIGAGYYYAENSYDDAYFMIGKFNPLNSGYPNGTSSYSTFGGSGVDDFTSVKIYPNQNEFVAVGFTNSKDGDVSGNHGNGTYGINDCWIVKLVNSNKIVGNVFVDLNANGIKDAGEPGFDNAKISTVQNGITQYAIPNQGHYTNLVNTGTYTTTITINKPYYTSTNNGKVSIFSGFGNTDTVNFPVQPIKGIRDYAISVTSLDPAKPDRDDEYVISYSNKGTDTLINKTIYFIKDSHTQFGYATPPIAKISGDTLSWVVTNVLPDSTGGKIKFYVKLDPIPLLNVGDTLVSTAYIDSTGDASTNDNTVLLRQIVTGSFDPNDKQESHGGFITPLEMKKEQYLNYTIRFQNLGNEAANSIIIRDTLYGKLDATSIEMTSSSHPYKFSLQYGKYAVWTFDNINLVDSTTNDSLSRGYISYRIKPLPGFVTGDTIRNSASIYFDFNPPVSTNTAVTVFTAMQAIWTGAISKAWENPLNWANGKVPDAGTDVYINGGKPNNPEINSKASCRIIYVNPNAVLKINTGNSLNVGGNYLPIGPH